MTLGKILDYSQARPPLGKVKGNGYLGVYRYVCSDAAERGLPGKRLTPQERDQILAAGLDLGLHGEDDSGAAKLGYTRGKQQGAQWADYASSVLQAPKGMTIVAAIDYDTAGTYPSVVSDYLHGVTDGMAGEYKTGVYGSIYVVDAALAEKTAVHGVQTNAWSNGKVSTWAHLYQHGGTEFPGTDFNDVLRVPHGTWLQTLTPQGDIVPFADGSNYPTKTDFEAAIQTQVTAALNKGTGAGQQGWAATNQAILSTVQQLINEGRTQTSNIVASVNSAQAAVLGYLAAHPATATLTDADKQAIAADIVAAFNAAGVKVDPQPFLQALSAKLAS